MDGDTAVVRTFHHEGAAVLEEGEEVVDLNREVFVLRGIGGTSRIAPYILNADPVQGEAETVPRRSGPAAGTRSPAFSGQAQSHASPNPPVSSRKRM